jgi:hypothetical protein
MAGGVLLLVGGTVGSASMVGWYIWFATVSVDGCSDVVVVVEFV